MDRIVISRSDQPKFIFDPFINHIILIKLNTLQINAYPFKSDRISDQLAYLLTTSLNYFM